MQLHGWFRQGKRLVNRMKYPERKSVLVAIVAVVILSSLYMLPMGNQHMDSQYSLIRVACVGDSITQGTYYPKDLQSLLGNHYAVGNFGLGGSTVLLNTNKPYMYRPVFENARNFRPNIAIIMLGTNDANTMYQDKISNFTQDYKMLISQFSSAHQIWLVLPPPIYNDSMGPKEANLVQNVIPGIQQVANELNLPTIDVYSSLLDHSDFFYDGVHPTAEGAQIIANTVYSALTNHTSAQK
jgi:acyl-CoA thioesterase I